MNKTLLMTCAAALAVLTAGNACADAAVYPGNLEKPSYLASKKEKMQGHVIEACCAYMEAIAEAKNPKSSLSEQEHNNKLALARKELLKRVEMYPDEINDTYWAHDALEASPLYAAVVSNDYRMVQLMLEKGALPFLPDYCYEGLELSPEVQTVLAHARLQYNVLEICLKARKAGITIEGEKPSAR